MKELTSHKVNECNEQIEIKAHPASVGGASVRYDVVGPRKQMLGVGMVPSFVVNLTFQDGPIAEGINGITNEALLAIVCDRLEGFQSGQYKCRENALAITKLEEAMHWLNHRTQQRLQRGVEGTHKV
jgi:hypothetical protein